MLSGVILTMKLITLYPYDPNGINPRNRVVNEAFTVSPPGTISDYSYTCLRGAPFFADTVVIKDGTGAGARTLIEGVDYWLAGEFVSASIALRRRICTMVAMLDESYSGTLYATYQTMGGNFTLADFSVMEELIRRRYTAIHISYEQIINLPAGFAPEFHRHQLGDMVGLSSVVDKLDSIRQAVASRGGSYDQLNVELDSHERALYAHTPSQVGLGNVENFGIATQNDVAARAANKYITARTLFDYVDLRLNGNQVDLTGYLTAAAANQLYQPKGNYQPAGDYVTDAELTQALTAYQPKGSYQPAGDYVTAAQLNQAIGGIGGVDLTGYVKKSDIQSYRTRNVASSGSLINEDFDGKTVIRCVNGSDIVITLPVPPGSFPTGAVVSIRRCSGNVTVVSGVGAGISPNDSLTLRRIGIVATFMYVGGGYWDLITELV